MTQSLHNHEATARHFVSACFPSLDCTRRFVPSIVVILLLDFGLRLSVGSSLISTTLFRVSQSVSVVKELRVNAAKYTRRNSMSREERSLLREVSLLGKYAALRDDGLYADKLMELCVVPNC